GRRGWCRRRRWVARVLTGAPRRRRGRVVPRVALDVATLDRAVARPGPGAVPGAQADGEQVVTPSRLPVVGHLDLIGVPGDAVDRAGALDVAGVRIDVEVPGDAGPVDLHRRGRAVVVVLEMAPEGAVLDAARHSEVRVGAV